MTSTPPRPIYTLTRGAPLFALVVISLRTIVGLLNAQTMPAVATFEVASIRPSETRTQPMRFDVTADDGLRATGVTLIFLLQKAYDVEAFQISGGPGWIRSDRFDVYAKPASNPHPPESSTRSEQFRADQFRARLTVLLAERFQLRVRQEFKDGGTYILEQMKTGHKLNEAKGSDGIGRNRGLITAENASMAMLAKTLSVTLQRPVLDQTELRGNYAFRLQWAEEGAPGEPEDSGVSLFTAIQEQLGLRLQSGKGPVKFVSVDQVERPSAN